MQPWQCLDRASVPGGGRLELWRRGDTFEIRIDGNNLMSTDMHRSEDELARGTLERLPPRPAPRMLIGGLGQGFTAAALAAAAPADAEIVVAEIVPEVVDWNHGEMGNAAGRPLDDPRVRAEVVDVYDAIAAKPRAWDAIMLDVDNGPDGLVRPGNSRLYDRSGLRTLHRAIRPGGVLAIWSAGDDEGFERRLAAARFEVERFRMAQGRGRRHVIWFALPH